MTSVCLQTRDHMSVLNLGSRPNQNVCYLQISTIQPTLLQPTFCEVPISIHLHSTLSRLVHCLLCPLPMWVPAFLALCPWDRGQKWTPLCPTVPFVFITYLFHHSTECFASYWKTPCSRTFQKHLQCQPQPFTSFDQERSETSCCDPLLNSSTINDDVNVVQRDLVLHNTVGSIVNRCSRLIPHVIGPSGLFQCSLQQMPTRIIQ